MSLWYWGRQKEIEPTGLEGCEATTIRRGDLSENIHFGRAAEDSWSALVHLRDGRFALVEGSPEAEQPIVSNSLGALLNRLDPTVAGGLPFTPAEGALSERFDEVAARVADDSLRAARDLAVDASVELFSVELAPLGYGARPRWHAPDRASDIAHGFCRVAEALRQGRRQLAGALARDAMVLLADQLEKAGDLESGERTVWENEGATERQPTPVDRFFDPEATAEEIAAVTATVAEWSSGEVTSPELFDLSTGKPERGGLHCQIVFGPVSGFRCACGAVTGASSSGERCERCGVTAGSTASRDTRFGHIQVAGITHPLAPGVELSVVPVVPPGDRPRRTSLARSRLTTTFSTCALDAAYARVVNRATRHRRLVELQAPEIILESELNQLQACFDDLLDAVANPAAESNGWGVDEAAASEPITLGPPPDWGELGEVDDEKAGLVWIDENRIAVVCDSAASLVSVAGGVIDSWPASGHFPRLSNGTLLVLSHPDAVFDDEERVWQGMQVRELESGAMLERYPESLPAIEADGDQPEDLVLRELHRGGGVDMSVSDRPSILAGTHDGRFLWIDDFGDGVVFDAAAGHPVGSCGASDLSRYDVGAFLLPDGTIKVMDDEEEDEDEDEDEDYDIFPQALAPHGDEWMVVSEDAVVGLAGEPVLALPHGARACGFSPDASRLAVLYEQTLWIVRIDEPALERRIELDSS